VEGSYFNGEETEGEKKGDVNGGEGTGKGTMRGKWEEITSSLFNFLLRA